MKSSCICDNTHDTGFLLLFFSSPIYNLLKITLCSSGFREFNLHSSIMRGEWEYQTFLSVPLREKCRQ